MLRKIINYFEKAQNKELIEYIQKNEDDFVFKSNLYVFPAAVLATIGCFFYPLGLFLCILVGSITFSYISRLLVPLIIRQTRKNY